MIQSKFAKAFILGMCITVFSATAAYADTGMGQSAAFQGQQVGSESSLLEKQKEIDRYVFEEHVKEIAGMGFTVTHTGPMGSFVEIGITPYSEANADYLYKVFGKDIVKVVEGQQAVLMTTAADSPDTPVSSSDSGNSSVNEDILKKQREIDQYLFEQHKDELAQKSFTVTHTAPLDKFVEIGITPYTEADAEYLYGIFGREQIRIVEGQQAMTMELAAGSDNAAELYAVSMPVEDEKTSETTSPMVITLLCAAGVAILGGTIILTRRYKFAGK